MSECEMSEHGEHEYVIERSCVACGFRYEPADVNEHIAILETRRDELLAVCQLVLDWNTSEGLALWDVVMSAKAAIANVRGDTDE